MTPEEAAARAARAEAVRRFTASMRYIAAKYGHLAGLTQQVAAQMAKLGQAWHAAGTSPGDSGTPGGSGSTSSGGAGAGFPQAPGVAWGFAGGGSSVSPGGGGGGSGGVYAPGGSGSTSGGGGGGGGGGGYASGGLVVSPIIRRGGADGFDGGPPVVAGFVTGYRWWTIEAPHLDRSPAHADADWPRKPLRGAWAPWAPGVNHAICLADMNSGRLRDVHDPASVPERLCGCGYWAYWGAQRHELGRPGSLPVFGVIKGYGKTLTGPHGFRAAKARILAVHLPVTIGDAEMLYAERVREIKASHRYNHPQFTGKVINIGTDHVPWPLQHRDSPDLPEPPTEDEIAQAKQKGEAWAAVIGDRIEQMYPGVEVCETRDHLLAKYSPDTVYGRGLQL